MRRLLPRWFPAVGSGLALALLPAVSAASPEAPAFAADVLPILRARCGACHGWEKTRGGLDLRNPAAVLAGGDSGPAVMPGKPGESLLWQRIEAGEMPPKGKPRLADAERHVLRHWIEQHRPAPAEATARRSGAITPRQRNFWSFRRPVKPPVPGVKHAEQVRTPIDAFVLQKLEARSLTLSPDAPREKLLRRVYFDVTGLPPTPAEIDAFVSDPSPDAFEKVVDRLLASPHYGERWARHWLDVAGYADSNGRRGDEERLSSWRYRDWVIGALNRDMPYNQFVTEQLAGDELTDWRHADAFTPEMTDKLVATGFLRCAPDATDNEMVDQRDDRYETLHDTVEIACRALLGLTVGCAKCHDHKYDPIPQADFYRLEACFQAAYDPANWLPANKRSFRDDNLRYLPAAGRAELAAFKSRNKVIDDEIARLRRQLGEAADRQRRRILGAGFGVPPSGPAARKLAAELRPVANLNDGELRKRSPEYAAAARKIDEAIKAQERRRLRPPAKLWALWDMSAAPPAARLLKRGNFRTPGRVVTPGVLSVLDDPEHPFACPPPDQKRGTTGRRRALAAWITRSDNPLTARVLVNRVWQHHFGNGIVKTPDDFGAEGARPTHPELLDWLAVTFVEEGWSLKKLHRRILLSSTYRQAADYRPDGARVDPANDLLWRKTPLRLQAEALRDALLAVSGSLNARAFGEPVRVKKGQDGQFVVAAGGPEGARRSIYVLNKRSESVTFLNVFDLPVMELNCPERFHATVPLQALALLNNEFVRGQAEGLARRVLREAGDAPARQVECAFRMALGRRPDREERAAVTAFLDRQTRGTADPATGLAALTNLCHTLLGANEFLYVD
jgi:hypothetical protein